MNTANLWIGKHTHTHKKKVCTGYAVHTTIKSKKSTDQSLWNKWLQNLKTETNASMLRNHTEMMFCELARSHNDNALWFKEFPKLFYASSLAGQDFHLTFNLKSLKYTLWPQKDCPCIFMSSTHWQTSKELHTKLKEKTNWI